MIGFSSANRVDMDELAQAAGMIGTQKALETIDSDVKPKQMSSESKKPGGQALNDRS